MGRVKAEMALGRVGSVASDMARKNEGVTVFQSLCVLDRQLALETQNNNPAELR